MSPPPNSGAPTSIAVKLAVTLAVVVVVVVGVWVTGGLITNDIALAMWLTAAWLGIAALACFALAWRRRALRVPMLGAYLLTAAVIGIYLGRSMLFDEVVNEKVVTVAPVSEERRADRSGARPGNVLLVRGRFESVAHPAAGTASAIRTAGGRSVLTLTSFEVDNGPDLRVYLVSGPARKESEVSDFKDLGALKGNKGNQQYELPSGLDLDRYSTVVIWCRAFSVNFARAPLG